MLRSITNCLLSMDGIDDAISLVQTVSAVSTKDNSVVVFLPESQAERSCIQFMFEASGRVIMAMDSVLLFALKSILSATISSANSLGYYRWSQ
jgi:hypothetical protein